MMIRAVRFSHYHPAVTESAEDDLQGCCETITGNCDTLLFLGGKEASTLKEISETLGRKRLICITLLTQEGRAGPMA